MQPLLTDMCRFKQSRSRIQLWALFLTLLAIFALMPSFADDEYAPPTGETLIVLISDINESYGSTSYSSHVDVALDYITRLNPDLVICAGDMVAGQKQSLSEADCRDMWSAFEKKVLSRLQELQIPFAFTLGNHDGSSSSAFAGERRIAEDFWARNLPDLYYIDNASFPACYSFAMGGIFFAVIDASSARIDPLQQVWLEEQLACPSAHYCRLRVVIGHLPLYAIAEGRNRTGDVVDNADALCEMLDKGNVDYYISGHHHAFYLSRKYRVKMISAGALGGGPRRLLGSDIQAVKTITTLNFPSAGSEFRILTHAVTNAPKLMELSDLPTELWGFNGNSQLHIPEKSSER